MKMNVLTKQVNCNPLRIYLCKNKTAQHFEIEASGIGLQQRPHQPLCY